MRNIALLALLLSSASTEPVVEQPWEDVDSVRVRVHRDGRSAPVGWASRADFDAGTISDELLDKVRSAIEILESSGG